MRILNEQQAKEFIECVLLDLWPQMADLAQRDGMMRVWLNRLIGYNWEELASALETYRACQSNPFRPEPGDLAAILRKYSPCLKSETITQADCETNVWIQCVSPIDGRGPVGFFVQLIYPDKAPPHDIILRHAQDWAQRHARHHGGLWHVQDGWTLREIRQEQIRLQQEVKALKRRD